MSTILEQGNMSDEEYLRLLGEQTQRECMPWLEELGIAPKATQKQRQKWYYEHRDDPEYKARRKAYMHDLRATEEFKAKRRKHDRERYHNDPEHRRHILDKNTEWNQNHAEAVAAYQQHYHFVNRDKLAAQKAASYADHKLGRAICTSCHQEYLVTDRMTTICNDCKKKALQVTTKNNTWYVGPYHRHILRMAGRLTPELDNKNYIVHHIDGIKDHNTLDNLLILSRGDHTFLHNQAKRLAYEAIQEGKEPPTMADVTRQVIREHNIKTY